ncbi:MAG: transcription termination/antitermination protein NusA, partial [Anaerolineae bacterium]|nr:transcription termination/antitermination protein NusA [Anaerolineae bacterium]
MKSEFVMAINQICSERNLPQEVIFEAIESALVSAYKRNCGSGPNIKAAIDFTTGTPHVYAEQIVVENVEDERFEIALREARRIEPEAQIGSLVRTEVTPKSFGRIAAQTAKQVILQRIREAERDALFSSYADREGELINGMVANITSQAITLNLGRTEAAMPRSQQVPGERYRIGQRIRAYVMEVRRTSRGPQIVVSRTHRQMLRRLLELEVPEIFSGTVEIKSIAREAGSRSKVAVAALQDGVDPVGSCVGIRGMRIQAIVNELGGEKIDIVEWSGDTSTFIGNALSPAKVSYVTLGNPDTDGKTATVVVPDDQLSLAIGKGGQNARLAAKLIGWRIDIKGSSEAQTEALKPRELAAAAPTRDRDILAMAEAILLGKEQPPIELELVPEAALSELIDDEGAEPVGAAVEPATSVELAMEEAAEPEASPILATAEALLQEQEPALAEAMEDEVAFELEAEVAEEIVKELELAQVEEMAIEPEPVEEAPAATREPRRPRYEYVKDERLEALTQTDKKTGRGKRRQLVRDEESGELIA